MSNFVSDQKARMSLRARFRDEEIGTIPASSGRPPLDFVGHAAVTDRLNKVFPGWDYSLDERFVVGNRCWIRGTMTIGGVSRPEYGDGKDPKEAIGNFIRRGAMRFGVALDLWSKEELEGEAEESVELEPGAGSAVTSSEGVGMGETAGESPAYGEGAGGSPTSSGTDSSPTAGAVSAPAPASPSDAQRWMDEWHPGKSHKLKQSDTVPALKFCTQGNGKCPYAVESKAKVTA